jgi:hypothetical protein
MVFVVERSVARGKERGEEKEGKWRGRVRRQGQKARGGRQAWRERACEETREWCGNEGATKRERERAGRQERGGG